MVDRSISFIRSLCAGEIEQEVLFPFPKMDPGEKELLDPVLEAIDDFLAGREADFQAWDRQGFFPPELIEELRQFGLFGLIIPDSAGGMGFGNRAYSRTLQQVARHDASIAVTIGAHSSIGMRGLKLFGTDEQKARYYERLASGEMIAAFCLTEPTAGSDAASIRTTAIDKGDHFLLNGSKIWITNGGIADFFTVFAKTGEAEARSHLSAFIVTRDMPGVSVSEHEDKMGLRASSTTSVYFEDVKVPKENLLGPLDGGFKVAMNILNSGRSGLGGGCVGAMKNLIHKASTHATERQQFGQPIGSFGMIKGKIGQMVVDCYAAESAVMTVAALSDVPYDDYSVEAAITKVFASEALWRSADEALQVAGGMGYMRELPYEQILRDCRINRIFEGTNEILRLFIALTALNDVGQGLREMAKSLSGIFDHPIKGFGLLYDYAKKRANWAVGYKSAKRSLSKCHALLRVEAELFEDLTRDLAAMADRILRKHGKNIIGKQFATGRMANVMIDLFVLGCVLSRVTSALDEKGPDHAASEKDIATIFAGQVRTRVHQHLRMIDENDDELLKELAVQTYEKGYTWDLE
ncbi:MAG: acyl-CoA dehydrogenase family protein [Acidobacteria bacterium]|nr:acyl-CoA dehydrogenase family protein [Acidobacteriota bacterium]MCB9399289.1 acyl-CoA dehydrogenase family protein [Acidobacteriota bacterium]